MCEKWQPSHSFEWGHCFYAAGAIWQKVERDSTFAETQPDVTLHWPITYMQVHIHGGLLCNLKAVISCLPHDHRDKR